MYTSNLKLLHLQNRYGTKKKKQTTGKLAKAKPSVYVTILWAGLSSLLQDSTLCTFIRRLGKVFTFPSRHLLYPKKCCKLLRVTNGPVWSMNSSSCPHGGHLLPGSKYLPEDEGHASQGRQTILSGRDMTSVRLLYLRRKPSLLEASYVLGTQTR